MSGCVLYRRDETWIDVDPGDEAAMFLAEGEFSESPAGPWKELPLKTEDTKETREASDHPAEGRYKRKP